MRAHTQAHTQMAPSASEKFISLVISCVGFQEEEEEEEEPQTAFPHVLYMGISYSRQRANGMLNSTQSIHFTKRINY